MTAFLALTPAPPPVAADPLPVAPRTNAERAELDYEAAQAGSVFLAQERNWRLAFDRAAEAFRTQGVELANPYTDAASPYGDTALSRWTPGAPMILAARARAEQARRLAQWEAAAQRLQGENPDALDTYPTPAQIRAGADIRAAQAVRAAEAAAGFGGGLGGFAGSVAGTLMDPVQLGTLALGAPWRAVQAGAPLWREVLRVAGVEAAIGGATQAAVEASNAGFRERLGLDSTALESIAYAAAGGAVIGGGLRGGVGLLERRALARAPGAPPPLREADAAALLTARLDELAGNPAGPEGVAAHEAALDRAVAQVAAGRQPAVTVAPASGRRLADWIEVPDAPDLPAAVAQFVDGAIDRPQQQLRGLSAGFLDEAEAGRLRALDLPVGPETARILTSSGVRHAWINHGPLARRPDGAPPITREDLVNWRGFIADAVDTQRSVDDAGRPAVMHLARDGAGKLVVVEELRNRVGALALSNMWRLPDGHGAQRLDQVPGMRDRARRARNSPPTHDARRRAGDPVSTSGTEGGLPGDMPSPLARFNTFTPAGRAVLVEPQVVDLAQLVPSHLEDGTPNPAYPHAEGVQPRDRGAGPSRDQVRAIAAGLIPERLAPNAEAGFGAPIVADDLVVESGNGRVMALRAVYGSPDLAHVADEYRAFLVAQGHDVAGMAQPVLVSRRVSALSPAERRAFVAEANGRATLAQNIAERARGDAALLDDALPLWRGGEVDAAENAPFVRAFLAGLTPEERGNLLTSGARLSAEGGARLRAALLARAYGDEMGPLLERFLEGDTDGLRGVAGALTDAAARWAGLRRAVAAGEVDPGMEATADLVGALRSLDEARRLKMPVADLLAQGDLDRAPLTDVGRAFLASMFDRPGFAGRPIARATLAARLDGFVEEAMKARPGPDLFGAPPTRPDAILDGVRLREAPAAPGAAGQAGEAPTFSFDPPPADAARARQAAALADDEALRAARLPPEQAAPAELLEAQRIAAAADITVPGEAADLATGAVLERGARDLLDEAAAEAEGAGNAATCLLGMLRP